MKKYGYIYIIELPDGETYVGKRKWHKRGLDPRYHGSGKLLKKYPIEERKITSLEITYSEEDACRKEIKWIAKLSPSLNLTSGGIRNDWREFKSEEEMKSLRQMISERTKIGMKKFYDSLTPEERLQKMHRDFTPEQIKKRNNKIKEHNNLPEVKKKISEASKVMWKNMSEEELERRKVIFQNMNKNYVGKKRSLAVKKGWITRKMNKKGNNNV